MRQQDRIALDKGKDKPFCKERSKYTYILYHCQPRQKWKRAKRNEHRKAHGLLKGDKRIVHHEDQITMDIKSSVVLDHCAHMRAHNRECK